MAKIWLHTNFKVNKFLAPLPGIRQYFLGNSGRNLVTQILGEQVFGVVAGDRKNLVNQYSDQKAKY